MKEIRKQKIILENTITNNKWNKKIFRNEYKLEKDGENKKIFIAINKNTFDEYERFEVKLLKPKTKN